MAYIEFALSYISPKALVKESPIHGRGRKGKSADEATFQIKEE